MKLVILTGAGMSAESGIKTFRDSDGLWENYRIEDVCTPEALERNPELVNHFYNERRKQLYEAQPTAGHKGLAGLENYFDVRIITQNIDDLHERAGSKHVLVRQADIFVIIGTSLAVYPAASLLHYAPEGIPVFVIDPKIPQQAHRMGYHLIEKGASEGVQELKNILLSETR